MEIKIQKFISDNGYCSRRKAEELVLNKKVKVNGKIATVGMRVNGSEKIVVEGEIISSQKNLLYIMLNKPVGYVCTNKKEEGEKNIFSLVDVQERLFVVGRLDKDSSGLVLLTNDGDFSYKLTHPSFSHEKEYIVQTSRDISKEEEDEFLRGVDIKEKTKAKMRSIERIGQKKYRVILTEGKHRQIRRMFEVFDSTVLALKRVRIDKYSLGTLLERRWKFIKK